MPQYICVTSSEQFTCSSDQTCLPDFNQPSDGRSPGFYTDSASQFSLSNWVDSLKLRCASGFEIGFFAATFFIGNVIGTSLLSKYADTHGRVTMLKYGYSLSTLLMALIIFQSNSKYTHYLYLFFLGVLSTIRTNCSYIYGTEIVHSKHMTSTGIAYNFCDSFTMIICSSFYKYFSKSSTLLLSSCLIFSIFTTLVAFTLPESPKFLAVNN